MRYSVITRMLRKSLLIAIGILLLSVQGMLFAPARLAFIPSAMQAILIPTLLILIIGLDFIVWKRYASGSRIEWIFPALQVLTILGVFFLLKDSASRVRESGLLVTVAITALTTYALFMTPNADLLTKPDLQKNTAVDVRYGPETVPVNDALNEQINSLTRQLFAEKARNTQLTLLNELSQQLEAELDPPVSAQLAVNTLERAMDCSLVALMTPEEGEQEYVVLAAAGRAANVIPPGHRQNIGIGLV